MTLQELIEKVVTSDREDWHKITCWGANSGPSYRDHLQFYNIWEGERGVLNAESHRRVAHPVRVKTNLDEGAPSRLLLAGWGFSSVEPEGLRSQ